LVAATLRSLTEGHTYHFQVAGEPGIGKSSFVQHIVRTQVFAQELDQLIWIDKPVSCDFARQLLIERLLPAQSAIGLQEYLKVYRTVIVFDGIEALYADRDNLLTLLNQLSDAVVFLICHYHEPILNTVQVVLPELEQAESQQFIRYCFETFSIKWEADEDTARVIYERVGGNPLALQLTILNWPRMNIHASVHLGLDAIFGNLYDSIEYPLRCIWIAFALVSPGAQKYEILREIWPQFFTISNMNRLVGFHLLSAAGNRHDAYSLVDSARNYIRERYANDLSVREIVLNLIEVLDNHEFVPIAYVESLLISDWIVFPEGKRTQWINKWWKVGLAEHRWATWGLFIEAEQKLGNTDVSIGLGYANCLRHLGETATAKKLLIALVERAGGQGTFADQAHVMAELAIIERENGAYRKATSWIERADRIARRLKLPELTVRCIIERAQIAVDSGEQDSFAQLLMVLPDSPRAELLRIEMLFLQNNIEAGIHFAERLLASPDITLFTKAYAHNLLGQIYEHLHDFSKAHEHIVWSLMIFEREGDAFAMARAQCNLGGILLQLLHYREAQILLLAAKDRQILLNDRVGLAVTRHNLQQLAVAIATS
jgi:hypothetical protein